MKDAAEIFRFVRDRSRFGEQVALVTITNVIGRSSRSVGTHMAVSETGAFAGSISSGCVEAAIVAEAVRVMPGGRSETVRFGSGSPYIDIRLPCGGGLDLLITPQPCLVTVGEALARLERREDIALALGAADGLALLEKAHGTSSSDVFMACHSPNMRLFVIGHGPETLMLTKLALNFGAEVVTLSPDAAIITDAEKAGASTHLLLTTGRSPHLRTDAHSAAVLLFHDHDWEGELLAQVLEQDAFFIGAMGSRGTHHGRIERLRELGVAEADLVRVEGPIGLIPSARDPATLALSVLAQIVERFQDRLARDARSWQAADGNHARPAARSIPV